MKEALLKKIDEFAAANSERLFNDIARLVAVNSVEDSPVEGGPFCFLHASI